MAVITEKLALVIDAKFGGAIAQFDKLESKVAKTSTAGKGLAGSLEKVGFSAQTAGKLANVGITGLTTGVTALVGVASQSISAFTALATEVRGVQRVMGGTAQDASRTAAELRAFGVDADAASKGMFRFARTLGDNPAALHKFGVEVARTSKGTIDLNATLRNVGVAYRGTAEATERAALVQAAFGRGGAALIPVLAATQQQLDAVDRLARSRGQILSDKDLEKARMYVAGLRQVKEERKALFQQVGKAILPDTTQFAAGLATFRELVKGKSFDAATRAGADVFGATQRAAAEQKAAADQKLIESTNEIVSAVLAAKQADLSLVSATLAVGDAERNLTAARKDLQRFDRDYDSKLAQDRLSLASATRAASDADARYAADKRALAHLQEDIARGAAGELAAQRALKLSTLDLAAAQRSLGDAKKRLADLQAGPDPNDTAEAQLRVEEATKALADARKAAASGEGDSAQNAININRATLDLARSQEQLAALQANSPEQLRAIADAQDEVARQTIAVEQANINQGTAARDAAEAGTLAADQLRAAAQQVVADQDARTAAVIAENTARQALADDEAGRTSALEALRARVASAENGLASARLGVTSATEAQRAATEKVNDLMAETPDAVKPAIDRLAQLGVAYDGVAVKAATAAAAIDAANKAAAGEDSQSRLQALGNLFVALNPAGAARTAASVIGGFLGRAGGGPVTAGTPYVVGEHRPELFVPNTNGRIVPRLPTGTTGGEVVEIHLHHYVDGREIAETVTRHQRDADRRGGDWRGRR